MRRAAKEVKTSRDLPNSSLTRPARSGEGLALDSVLSANIAAHRPAGGRAAHPAVTAKREIPPALRPQFSSSYVAHSTAPAHSPRKAASRDELRALYGRTNSQFSGLRRDKIHTLGTVSMARQGYAEPPWPCLLDCESSHWPDWPFRRHSGQLASRCPRVSPFGICIFT